MRCGLEVADFRKNCDCGIAVAEQYFFKKLRDCVYASASFKLRNCDCGLKKKLRLPTSACRSRKKAKCRYRMLPKCGGTNYPCWAARVTSLSLVTGHILRKSVFLVTFMRSKFCFSFFKLLIIFCQDQQFDQSYCSLSSRRGLVQEDKRMVLVYTHGLFIT